MKKYLKFGLIALFLLVVSLSVVIWAYEYIDYSYEKTPSDSQFDFDGNYTPPELTIDGIADEEEWASAPVIAEYHGVEVKMFRGTEALFFFFDVVDNNLLTQGNSNDDSVTRSDSIELYIDTQNDGGRTPQSDDYQFNFGIHNKTRIMQGSGSNWGNWNGLIDYEVHLKGTLNDNSGDDIGYSIEVMVPYSQINIQKNSTIGIAFGRVDKFGIGDVVETDWRWYGWTWGGKLREPQTIDNYVSITADGTIYDREELPKENSTIIGTILNDRTNEPIEGVKITYQEDSSMTTTTDASGYFIFTDVDPEKTYIFDVIHNEYFDSTITYTREELRDVDGGAVNKTLTLIEVATAEMTTITGVVENVVEGFVENAIVSISGTNIKTTTDSNGVFEINEIPASSGIKVLVNKDGFETEEISISKNDILIDGTTLLGTLNLSYEYNNTQSFGGSRGINSYIINVTRSLTGIRFLLETDSLFEGPEAAILYIQGGKTGVDKPFAVKFEGTGNISFDKGGNNWRQDPTDDIEYKIVHNENPELGAKLYIEIPYEYMKMENNKLDPFGLSAGSWGYEGGNLGWDGMGSQWGFIDPDVIANYVRYNHLNNAFQAPNNNVRVDIVGDALRDTKITIGTTNVTANVFGRYRIIIERPDEDVTLIAKKDGYVWYEKVISASDLANTFEYTLDIVLEERLNTLEGKVIDNLNNPVEGALIEVLDGENVILTTLTNDLGEWSLVDVPTDKSLRIEASKEGLYETYKNVSLQDLNGLNDLVIIDDLMLSHGILSIKGTVEHYLNPLEGVNIEVVGAKSSTTDSDGTFSLDEIPLGNLVINFTKANYESKTLIYNIEDLEHEMTLDLDIVSLGFKSAELGNFGDFTGFVTRGVNGFEFLFETTNAFNPEDRIDLYISTENPTTEKDLGTYLFALGGDKTITITDFDQTELTTLNETVPNKMELSVENGIVSFVLPYVFFEAKGLEHQVSASDVIGISLEHYVHSTNKLNTWSYDKSGQSIVNGYVVNKDNPKDYVRLSFDNLLYNAQSNYNFDLDQYPIQFGVGWSSTHVNNQNSDRFFGKVSRDDVGITFEFISLSNTFTNDELILIYLDLNENANGGWNNDYLFKLRGNGLLYGNVGAWWNALKDPNFLVSEDNYEVTIDRSNGYTEISLTLPYETIGIESDDVIGFALREALQGDINHPDHTLYDPWHDFYYQDELEDKPYSRWFGYEYRDSTGRDAANEAQFVRIAVDGTLYSASSNIS